MFSTSVQYKTSASNALLLFTLIVIPLKMSSLNYGMSDFKKKKKTFIKCIFLIIQRRNESFKFEAILKLHYS